MKIVALKKNYIKIPQDLYKYLNNSKYLFINSDSNSNLFILKPDIKNIVKIILQFLIKKDTLLIGKFKSKDAENIQFNFIYSQKYFLENCNYRIANYDRRLALLKSTYKDLAIDRQAFWKSVKKYHEHIPISHQKKFTWKVTSWFAKVLNETLPKSILELGCGSGRNLYYLKQINPECKLYGVEINQSAIKVAKEQIGNNFEIIAESIYDLKKIKSKSIDIVFTSGVLMHIPYDEINSIILEMSRIAKKKVIHYELHGPSNNFDFHRYPRDYKRKYDELFPDKKVIYKVFPKNNFRSSGTKSFNMSLLKYKLIFEKCAI